MSLPRVDPPRLRPLLPLCALGVALRLALLFAGGELELQSDEANYVYLGIAWNHFGVYLDQHRYLWPPGYTWFLARCLDVFGFAGILVAKLLQILASASVGLTTMLFAWRLFGARSARVAGWMWVLYLPLAAFTHRLWNETLFLACFLPALYQLLVVLQEGRAARSDLRLVTAGTLFAGALFLKEAPLYLLGALALLLVPNAGSWLEGTRRAALLLAVVAVWIVPWGLHNREVYGHFVPLGTSLGENAYNGLNEQYRNFDLIPLEVERQRRELSPLRLEMWPWFIAAEEGSGWVRAEPPQLVNTVQRSQANTAAGLRYLREHPGWFLRTRIKKLADLATPSSFYTRHLALGHYDSSVLGSPLGRKLSALWALLCPLAVLALGVAGGLLVLDDVPARWLFGTTIGYFLVTSMLVAMSRFRLPIVPLLIALAAGLLVHGVHGARAERGGGPGRGRCAAAVGALAALVFLWWVDLPETWTVLREMVWRTAA